MHSTTLDMTKGSPWKLIAGFALPVLLSQIFQQLYNTADTLIVGRYLGDEALAAVSSSGPLIFLLISFFEVPLLLCFRGLIILSEYDN